MVERAVTVAQSDREEKILPPRNICFEREMLPEPM
jgi:hypothetical protein